MFFVFCFKCIFARNIFIFSVFLKADPFSLIFWLFDNTVSVTLTVLVLLLNIFSFMIIFLILCVTGSGYNCIFNNLETHRIKIEIVHHAISNILYTLFIDNRNNSTHLVMQWSRLQQ